MSITYMLQTGKSLEVVLMPGMVATYDNESGKYEALLTWLIKGHTNKSYVNQFLQGKQSELRENKNGYSEKIGTVVGGKELSFIDSGASTIFDGSQVVYGNTYKLSNVILVPRSLNEVQAKEFVYNRLGKMIVDQYPIPIEASWKDFFISEIFESSVKELKIFGKIPYASAYFVSINSADIGDALAGSYGRQQFIENFNRAPGIRSLWKMIDPIDRFNMKTWVPFLKLFGGKEEFEKINSLHQESLVYLYETFGIGAANIKDQAMKHKIDLNGIPFKSSAIAIAKGQLDFNEDLAAKAFKIVLENSKDQRQKVLAVGALMDSLGELDLKDLVKKPSELLAKLQGASYNAAKGAEGIAFVAGELWLGKERYNDYESNYLRTMPNIMKTSRYYPTVSGKLEDTDYSWESMDMGNPRGWFLGIETNCCQHLHNAGSSCVIYAAENPSTSGMFRVMKKGSTVAQSWFWINKESGSFVFDNIEVLGSELRDSIFDCYMDFINKELRTRKDLFGYKTVSVGLGYNDMPKLTTLEKLSSPKRASQSGKGSPYSDAASQVYLAKFED